MSSELLIDTNLVRRLIAKQFPQWAHLPISPVAVSGWDNRTFHLGSDLSVRLPSAAGYAAQVAKEHRWLPVLAPHLPLPIPAPVALGLSAEGYPFAWSVYRWLPGETVTQAGVRDELEFAADLAAFLRSLWQVDAVGGPPPGEHSASRGGKLTDTPLEFWKEYAQPNLPLLGPDAGAALKLWETALQSEWQAPPVWVHGDVVAGNLLVQNGKLSAVIDFGCSAVGDPACDLVMAWTFFSGESHRVFQEGCGLDKATWQRARGWAVWKALLTIDDPQHEAWARRTLTELLKATDEK